MSETLLKVERLAIEFKVQGRVTRPVRGVSLELGQRERLALVGESGCGKSLTAMALTRLPPTDRAHLSGRIIFDGQDVLGLSQAELPQLRRQGIAYVFQDPTNSLNPVMRIRSQMAEVLQWLPARERLARATDLLARTGLPDPERAARAYPCELSGGQQQRAMLAMALAARPRLLVADEPTTALDVTTQQQVLDLIDELAVEYGMAVLLITHNLGLVSGRTQRTAVMYAGKVVECGSTRQVLSEPCHPYTRGLIGAVPSITAPRGTPLRDIPGSVPAPHEWPPGCAFAPRCEHVVAECRELEEGCVLVR